MKYYLLLLFATIPFFSYTQEKTVENDIAQLKKEISKNKGAKKLMLMDSLSNVIAYSDAFKNDSIVRATIQYAKELDSANIVVWQSANLLFYLNNIKSEPQKAKTLFLENKKWASRISDPRILSKYYVEAGNTHFYLNEFEKSLQFFDSSYQYAQKNNNLKFMGLSKLGQGQVYTDMGDFGKASLTLQKALKFFLRDKDTSQIVGTRNSLTILYSKNGFYEEAKKERDEMIRLEKMRNSRDNMPVLYYNAAADYNKMGLQEARIKALKQSLQAARLSRFVEYYEPIMRSGLLAAYAENDSIAQAEKIMAEINKNSEKYTTGPFKQYYLEGIKNLAFAKKNYPEAIRLGKEYLELKKQGKQYEEIQQAENFMYKVYKAMGDNDQALEHFENFRTIKDSIEAAQKVRVLSYYQTLYETEKRDHTITAQKINIALLDEKNKVKNQWLLFGGLGFLAIFGFVWIIRSRNFARRKHRMQESFTQDILKSQENEKARIASELHDSVGQKLLMLKNSLSSPEREAKNEMDLVGETIKEVREMSHGLHPFQFEKLGLMKSLKNMVEAFQKNSNVFYSEAIETPDGLISKEKEIYVFRMLQECMANVEKHADATACNLSSEAVPAGRQEKKGVVLFTLKDNGKGFTVPQNEGSFEGLGMKTLKERAQLIEADLTILSTPGEGTTVTIKVPKK